MARKVWKGGAPAVAEVQTIAVDGTWANADTATIVMNEKKVTYTVAGLTGNTQAWVNSQLCTAINTAKNTTCIPEFREITPVNTSNTVMTITGPSIGKPFTLTTEEVTAGNGELGDPATTQSGQGPNHFFLANNWAINGVPASGDLLIYEDSDVDCLYGLSRGNQCYNTIVKQSFTGTLGLPRTNKDDAAYPYVEYRERYLKAVMNTITIGQGTGSGSGRLMFNPCNVKNGRINIYDAGSAAEANIEPILLVNTSNTTHLSASKGIASINRHLGEIGYEIEPAELHTLRIGYRSSQAGDVIVRSGSNTTLNTVEMNGGTLEVEENGIITLNMSEGDVSILDGAGTTWNIDAGTVKYLGDDTLTTVRVGGGATLDFRADMRGRTVTNMELHARGSLHDPHKTVTWTNGIDLYRCNPKDVTLDIGDHQTLTPSAI